MGSVNNSKESKNLKRIKNVKEENMCKYCEKERQSIYSKSIQNQNALITINVHLDEENFLKATIHIQTVNAISPFFLRSNTKAIICPMCGRNLVDKDSIELPS